MDTLTQINKLQEQIKKNEAELAAVKERQQKTDAKIQELNKKRRSLQMKAINKARAATRKRHILLGEVLERYMGREIDPDIFEVFLNCLGAFVNFKKGGNVYFESLPTYFESWLSSDPQYMNDTPISNNTLITFSECKQCLQRIAENEEKRKLAFKQGDSEFVHEIEWEIDEDRKTLGLVPKYDENH